ncbi:hypothetical protein C8R44DRAFT_887438 [Mycena epipterygia]|nr:hypothetical protein C8R44DRAFT_887438 [Mycena epipterygia]
MAPQFTSAPTKYTVRPLLNAPCAVTLPLLLTNIIPEQFPFPRILNGHHGYSHALSSSRYSSRTYTCSRYSSRTYTWLPHVAHLRLPAHLLLPAHLATPRPTARQPSAANIQTIKSLFEDLYPDLVAEEQMKEYMAFRSHLDTLCARYLRPALALSHQDKAQVNKVNKKMTETFEWLAEYELHWPVAVCLQGKLHNSAARSVDKSTRKVINAITGVAPRRAGSKRLDKKRKTTTPSP